MPLADLWWKQSLDPSDLTIDHNRNPLLRLSGSSEWITSHDSWAKWQATPIGASMGAGQT